MSDDDNVPYRQTEAYRQAAEAAAEQNRRQRRGACSRVSHFPDEPWGIPGLNVWLMEVRADNTFFIEGEDRASEATARRFSRLAGHATTWEVSYSVPYARRALAQLQYDGETDE